MSEGISLDIITKYPKPMDNAAFMREQPRVSPIPKFMWSNRTGPKSMRSIIVFPCARSLSSPPWRRV